MGNHQSFGWRRSIAATLVTFVVAGSVGCGGASSGAENRNPGDCYFETAGQSREELNAAIEDAMNGIPADSECVAKAGSLAEVTLIEPVNEPSPHFRVWLRLSGPPAHRQAQETP